MPVQTQPSAAAIHLRRLLYIWQARQAEIAWEFFRERLPGQR